MNYDCISGGIADPCHKGISNSNGTTVETKTSKSGLLIVDTGIVQRTRWRMRRKDGIVYILRIQGKTVEAKGK